MWGSFLLTHYVDLSADSFQLLLQFCGHDGYLAGINDVGHTVDLVLDLWKLTVAKGLRLQSNRGVELSHTGERKVQFVLQKQTTKSENLNLLIILLNVTKSST